MSDRHEIILGLSAYYHDSAAVLLVDGRIAAAAQEERFTRKKHDPSFPSMATAYVLDEAGVGINDLSVVAFYEKPFVKFERLLETYHGFAPKGLKSFLSSMPAWVKEKLLVRKLLRDELAKLGPGSPEVLFPEHHLSHAASAFYPSPFKEAAILTVDGVGEWATTTIGHGNSAEIRIIKQLDFPHSLGLLYSAFTYYCGFKVNSGEYKLMGLAPYGDPHSARVKEWEKKILEELVDLRDDGSFLLNMDYFNYATGLTMCNDKYWERLFGIGRRSPEARLDQEYADMALAIQHVTEEIILRLARTTKELVGCDYLALAGGVTLNCVANGKLLRENIFKDIWVQPAAGDAGGALGAAFAAWHIGKNRERTSAHGRDLMQGSYLGPEFCRADILRAVRRYDAPHTAYDNFDELCSDVAGLLASGHIVGWFQGRMEYGPRALGNRSILGDPRQPSMQKTLNLKIKHREGFRPFAPAVLAEKSAEYFELDRPSPYMLLVAPVRQERRNPLPEDNVNDTDLFSKLHQLRSDIPAVTHVDFSARIQTVHSETNPRFWNLIDKFDRLTGCGLLVNTSFNVRGEPIVLSPRDAYRCFLRTDMDYLVMGDFVFDKKDQPKGEAVNWTEEYGLD